MAANLVTKGVQASASDGLTTLAGKILDISGGGGSCYHIEFSESSYTAVGGSATLEVYLQENYQPKASATVTVTGSDSSSYTGLTNSSGVATVTVSGLTADTTFTCSYSNVSDTCTVTMPSYLFYDGGVTGNVNTNYTKTNSGVNAAVSTTGTKISCSYYGDAYYKANVLLSGDFQITYNLVQKTNDSGGFALLNSSNSVQAYIEFVNTSKVDIQGTSKSQYTYSNYSSDSIVKVTRVGSTITLYLDNVSIGSKTMSTGDVYFGWKTHSAGSRNFTFKELKIEAL